jgi:hypothetical protein
LPEAQRRRLLWQLEQGPAGGEWRALALRFLQRQVEKESVRQLMDGGSLVPVDFLGNAAAMKGGTRAFPRRLLGWVSAPAARATAAGLLIAATSAMVTMYAMKSSPLPAGSEGASAGATAEFHGNLPGDLLGVSDNVAVTVPVVAGGNGAANLFPASTADGPVLVRRSVVIEPDGSGNAVVIPVNTMRMKVY